MRRILAPLDGSGLAARTVGTAADLADRLSAHLVLLRVVPGCGSLLSDRLPPHSEQAVSPAVRDRIEGYFDFVLSRIQTSLLAETEMAAGPPAEQILRVALEKSVDLIVMTTHGREALSRSALGAVTEVVLAGTTVPVFVMHPEILPMPWESLPPREVVIVPLDGTLGAERAIALARELAGAYQAQLQLLRVVPAYPAPALAVGRGQDPRNVGLEFTRARQAASDYLEEAARPLRVQGVRASTRVTAGLPREEVATAAARERNALVVMASRRLSVIQGRAPGSVADALVQTGPVPTVVIPLRRG